MELRVLHCDNHVLAVVKPVCVPVVPDASGDVSLLDSAKAWLKAEFDKPGEVFLGVVSRLDRPVSGVVVFARTSKAARRLTGSWKQLKVNKRYLGVGEGVPGEAEGELRQWLWKDRERNQVATVAAPEEGGPRDAKPAVTRWRVLEERAGRTLFELEPVTGRSHQLRVAAATLGAPLLGDLKYGAAAPLADRSVALHAQRLVLPHPVREEELAVAAPPPETEPWRGWVSLE